MGWKESIARLEGVMYAPLKEMNDFKVYIEARLGAAKEQFAREGRADPTTDEHYVRALQILSDVTNLEKKMQELSKDIGKFRKNLAKKDLGLFYP